MSFFSDLDTLYWKTGLIGGVDFCGIFLNDKFSKGLFSIINFIMLKKKQ